mgnify:CR=1 FL=1
MSHMSLLIIPLLVLLTGAATGCKSTKRRRRHRVVEPQNVPPPAAAMSKTPMRRSTRSSSMGRYPEYEPSESTLDKMRRMNPPGKIYSSSWRPPMVPKRGDSIKVKDLKPQEDPPLVDGKRTGKIETKECKGKECADKGRFKVRN